MSYVSPDTERDVRIHDEALANGDPVVAVVHKPALSAEAVTLGTGWHTMDELVGDVNYAIDTGRSTTYLPPEAAEVIEDAERVDLFTLASTIVTEDE